MFKLTMTTVWTVLPRTCGQTMHGDVGNPASGLYPGPTTPYPLSREGGYQTRGLLSEEFQQNSWTWEVFSFTRRLAVVQKPKLEEWNSDSNTHEATSGYYREYIKASSMKAWSISTKKANYLRGFPDTESSDRTHHTEREAHVSPPRHGTLSGLLYNRGCLNFPSSHAGGQSGRNNIVWENKFYYQL